MASFKIAQCKIEWKVVGGDPASIQKFPHAAFISVECKKKSGQAEEWVCGGSILNQEIILTAASCLHTCMAQSRIAIMTGHENFEKGFRSSALSFVIHDNYHPKIGAYDVGLVRLKTPIKFGKSTKRVALFRNPPQYHEAMVAGWGITDELLFQNEDNLHFISQRIWDSRMCIKLISKLHEGSFCAKNADNKKFTSFGDCGGALIVRDYIQIGIVSHKLANIANHVIVYTNVSYFFNWIKEKSKSLACPK